jgi:hypothetical protein
MFIMFPDLVSLLKKCREICTKTRLWNPDVRRLLLVEQLFSEISQERLSHKTAKNSD